jgi:hypothetical protein
MKFTKSTLIFLFILLPVTVMGQYYNSTVINRPAGLNWQQLQTDHFRIIFPNGQDSVAYRSAAILEAHYMQTSALTGGTLSNFPVVLNSYNDLSNGFVTSYNFRSEIDIAPQKGKGMNPLSGDWLEHVLSHELVHATHFNIQQPAKGKKVSIPNVVSILSRDFARSFHGFPPVGLHEGLAVYYETESVAPMGGRGNYPFFTNRFNSNFGSSGRWNMGQTFMTADYTQPYNRHYISGYTFIDWLHNEYGDDISREAIRFHYHNFFLGYGFALRKKTGKWPGQLYTLYEEDLAKEEDARLASISSNTTEKSQVLDTRFKGEELHAPKWISDNELVFTGAFYNARIGLYSYRLDEGSTKLIKETFVTSDYNYEIENGNELYFSSHFRNPKYPGIYGTRIQKLNFETGRTEELITNESTFAATTNGNRTLAIQQVNSKGSIVEVLENGELSVLKSFESTTPIALRFNPQNPNQLAVVMNRRGVQGLWITSLQALDENLDTPPVLAFRDASIHDPEWHPGGEKLMFTMDAAPAMNVYEYDLESGEIHQLTSSLYNAFEASYSPSGDRIAYVLQQGDERKLAILHRDDFVNQQVAPSQLLTGESLNQKISQPLTGSVVPDSIRDIEKSAYRGDVSWLKPRTIFPVYREKAGVSQIGLGFTSVDALSRQAYSLEFTGIQERLWYDFSYINKTFYPGFKFSGYSDPEFFTVSNPNTGNTFSLMRQDRGFSLSLPLEYTFRGDTRYSSIYFEPKITAEQFKYYNLIPSELSDFTTRFKAGFFSQLSLGILNLRRDVQPSSGLSFFGLVEKTLNEPTAIIQFPGGDVSTSFSDQWTAYYGVFGFVSPLRRWNQSLRLDLQFLQQSASPIYSNGTILPFGFESSDFPNYSASDGSGFQNLGRFSTRYTIPLFYPDNGGLTVPLYLSSIYLTTFTHTLTDLNSNDLVASSRSIFGAGFHVQFKLSNLMFDLGVGFAYEPTRDKTQFLFGQF